MRKLRSRIFLGAVLFLLAHSVFAETPGDLKVVSWNMEWFPGHRPTASVKEVDKHMAAGKEALKKIDPDIFVAIEIRDWDAFRELCTAVPGLTPLVVSSFLDPVTGEVRPQQIGIASKLPCQGSDWEPWKANIPGIPRGYSFAALEDPATHKLILVYGNHLKSNRGSDAEEGAKLVADMRNEQATQLVQVMEDSKTRFGADSIRGWLVTGDLNTNHDGQFPDCHVIDILTKAGFVNTWAGIPKEQRATWRGDYQKRHAPTTFDYILTRGFGDDLKASMIETPRAVSDHYPVTVAIPKS